MSIWFSYTCISAPSDPDPLFTLELPFPMWMTAEPDCIVISITQFLQAFELSPTEPVTRRVNIIQVSCPIRKKEMSDDKASFILILFKLAAQPRDVFIEVSSGMHNRYTTILELIRIVKYLNQLTDHRSIERILRTEFWLCKSTHHWNGKCTNE